VDALIKVKEVLKDLESKKDGLELGMDSCHAALLYFKKGGGSMDKMIEQLDNSSSLWSDCIKQVTLLVAIGLCLCFRYIRSSKSHNFVVFPNPVLGSRFICFQILSCNIS